MFTVEDVTTHQKSVSCTLDDMKMWKLDRVYAVAINMRPGTTRVFTDASGRKLRLRRHH